MGIFFVKKTCFNHWSSSRISFNFWSYDFLKSDVDVKMILQEFHNGFHFQEVFLRLALKESRLECASWMQVMDTCITTGLVFDLKLEGGKSLEYWWKRFRISSECFGWPMFVRNCFYEGESGVFVKLMIGLGDEAACWYCIWIYYIWSVVI